MDEVVTLNLIKPRGATLADDKTPSKPGLPELLSSSRLWNLHFNRKCRFSSFDLEDFGLNKNSDVLLQ